MLTADASFNNSALPEISEIYPDTNRLCWGRPGVASSNWPPAKAKSHRLAMLRLDSWKKQNICYMVEPMFFRLDVGKCGNCWLDLLESRSLEQNQLLWHRVSNKPLPGSKGPLRWLDEVAHLNGSTISMTASILPVSVPSAGQKLQIPCVSRMAAPPMVGKSKIYVVSNYVVPGAQSTNEALANMESYSRNMLSNRANHPPIWMENGHVSRTTTLD